MDETTETQWWTQISFLDRPGEWGPWANHKRCWSEVAAHSETAAENRLSLGRVKFRATQQVVTIKITEL